jgi:type 1 fimbria pilin
MRAAFASLMAIVFLGSVGGPAFAKTATVTGQVVDQECYLREGKVDTDKTCAVECAKSGKPMALLTSDGKVYEIAGGLAANKNEKLVAHVLHTVEITGDVSEKSGKMTIAADSLKMIK